MLLNVTPSHTLNLQTTVLICGVCLLQMTSPSSSMGSNDENSAQSKRVDLGTLIDFTEDPEPPVAAASQPSIPQQTNILSSNGGDWASFDNVGQQPAARTIAPEIAPQTAANAGLSDSALAQLSTPGPAPTPHMPPFPLSGVNMSHKINDGGKWPAVQQHQASIFSADLSQPANPPFNAPVAGSQASLFVCVMFVFITKMLTARGAYNFINRMLTVERDFF